MNRYLLNLYKQYCDARGIPFDPFDSKKDGDFIKWIEYNERLTKKYKEYLICLGYINGKKVSEVGKGVHDTLLLPNSAIVSPYAKTMRLPNSELFITGVTPLIQEKGALLYPDADILLTYNPFEEMRIIDWSKIHNSKMFDVSIGFYGSVHDSDFDSKIELLEKISKKMYEDHKIDFDTDKDNYFCSISSKRKIKERELILTR